MKNTIYNTYVIMQSQEQCDRMKQFCLDNNLPIWEDECAFDMVVAGDILNYYEEDSEFFVMMKYEAQTLNKTEVTEEEFKSLII